MPAPGTCLNTIVLFVWLLLPLEPTPTLLPCGGYCVVNISFFTFLSPIFYPGLRDVFR